MMKLFFLLLLFIVGALIYYPLAAQKQLEDVELAQEQLMIRNWGSWTPQGMPVELEDPTGKERIARAMRFFLVEQDMEYTDFESLSIRQAKRMGLTDENVPVLVKELRLIYLEVIGYELPVRNSAANRTRAVSEQGFRDGYSMYVSTIWRYPSLAAPGKWEEYEKSTIFKDGIGQLERLSAEHARGWDAVAHHAGRHAAMAGEECKYLSSEVQALVAYTINEMSGSSAGVEGLTEMATSHAMTKYQVILQVVHEEYSNAFDPDATFPNLPPEYRGL